MTPVGLGAIVIPWAVLSFALFTHRETDRAAERWQFCALRQPYTLAGERSSANDAEVTFEFFDAGRNDKGKVALPCGLGDLSAVAHRAKAEAVTDRHSTRDTRADYAFG